MLSGAVAVSRDPMRVYELTAQLKKINRSPRGKESGRTATAAAAYRASALIECEYSGMTHDYRRKQGREASEIHCPDHAPAWASDRSALWNAAELRERNGARGKNARAFKKDAVTAREMMFGFPAELSPAGRLDVARTVARHLVAAHGVAIDFSIHAPGRDGDQRNHHCHLMMTTRRIDADGLGEKAREWDGAQEGKQTIAGLRGFLAATMNDALAREGQAGAVRVEHRSHKDRGTGITPTRHQGPGRTNGLRKQQRRERAVWEQGQRRQLTERHAAERSGLSRQHDSAMQARQREHTDREATAASRMTAEREAERAQAVPKGLARIWEVATGQAGRADAAREAQAAERARQDERKLGELRDSFRVERSALDARHEQQRRTMGERHQGEHHQLDRAAMTRVEVDRHAEVTFRRDQVREQAHERQHEHERDRRQP